MGYSDAYDQEAEAFSEDLAAGRITLAEYNIAIRNLERSYREDAEEAAQDAYDAERNRW